MSADRPGRLLKVAVSGASGLIGGALVAFLARRGHRVLRLVRRPPASSDEIAWDPGAGRLDPGALRSLDAVVHLAGESLAAGRWTGRRRRRLRASRVDSTRLLAAALAALDEPPEVLVSASAIGYYGDTGDRLADEGSPTGEGFLARLCRDWEAAADPARTAGVRVVHPRFGVVLAAGGGALARLVPVFRLGLGGPLGNGRQWVSWITLGDAVRALAHLLTASSLAGPANLVAPQPVRNRELAAALGAFLSRPALVPVPVIALRLLLGAMAEETLLASTRVAPRRLLEDGFTFHTPVLEQALRSELAGDDGGQ